MSEREQSSKLGAARDAVADGLKVVEPYLRDSAQYVGRTSREFLKTKTGKRAATGAAAGGVIGAALPFVSVLGAAMVGAGVVVLVKSLKDKD